MKIFVVMGNDYPDRVYADEANAKAYVEDRTSAAKLAEERRVLSPRIYWRYYDFEVR